MYLIKTEIIDKERLSKDNELMTSARWMTEYRPVGASYALNFVASSVEIMGEKIQR
jgi:hypothetical protein